MPRVRTGVQAHGFSRDLLEWALRERVRALPTVHDPRRVPGGRAGLERGLDAGRGREARVRRTARRRARRRHLRALLRPPAVARRGRLPGAGGAGRRRRSRLRDHGVRGAGPGLRSPAAHEQRAGPDPGRRRRARGRRPLGGHPVRGEGTIRRPTSRGGASSPAASATPTSTAFWTRPSRPRVSPSTRSSGRRTACAGTRRCRGGRPGWWRSATRWRRSTRCRPGDDGGRPPGGGAGTSADRRGRGGRRGQARSTPDGPHRPDPVADVGQRGSRLAAPPHAEGAAAVAARGALVQAPADPARGGGPRRLPGVPGRLPHAHAADRAGRPADRGQGPVRHATAHAADVRCRGRAVPDVRDEADPRRRVGRDREPAAVPGRPAHHPQLVEVLARPRRRGRRGDAAPARPRRVERTNEAVAVIDTRRPAADTGPRTGPRPPSGRRASRPRRRRRRRPR